MHCLIDSTDSYFVNTRNKSLGFILADEGYDVWAFNSRGNKHSEAHKTLDSTKEFEYWKHGSLHDIAKKDIPALFEYVKKITGV